MTRFANFSLASKRDFDLAVDSEHHVLEQIERHGLTKNAWELDSRGYTVLFPEQVKASGMAQALREAIVSLAGERTGSSVDLHAEGCAEDQQMLFGRGLFLDRLLFAGQIFEKAMLHAPALALIQYLLGRSCVLSHMSGMLKSRGDEYLELHTDQVGSPAPLPPYAQTANATWALTDYSPENGSICFVDGSHRLCRHPTSAEAVDIERFHPITAPAGSIIIWGGNMWHGAVPRSAPGLRVSLLLYFCRHYITQSDNRLRCDVTPEMLARNPEEFKNLVGHAGRRPNDNSLSEPSFAAVGPATSHGATTMNQFA